MTQPDTDAPTRVWTDRLSRLLSTLTDEARAGEPGIWAARWIRQGFQVALTIGEDGLRRLRVSTQDRPGTAAAWGRFHRDVDTLTQHIGIAHWQTVAPESGYRGAVMEFLEPRIAA